MTRHWGLRGPSRVLSGVSSMALLAGLSGLVGCTGGVTALEGTHRYAGAAPEAAIGPAPSAQIARPLPAARGDRSRNTGWRVGAVHVQGTRADDRVGLAEWLQSEYKGVAEPVMLSVFGYQWDIERGGEGQTKMVVEIIPAIAGLDKSMLIPTLNVLFGLRFPRADGTPAFEFGAGPHLAARNSSWFQELVEWDETEYPKDDIHAWGVGFTVGIGYTFTVGQDALRIPVNFAAGFAADGIMWSLTAGWSMKGD